MQDRKEEAKNKTREKRNKMQNASEEVRKKWFKPDVTVLDIVDSTMAGGAAASDGAAQS